MARFIRPVAGWRVTTDELARAAQPIDDIDRDPARFSAEQTTPVGPVLARFFGVSPVTAVDVKTVYLSRREWWTHHRGGCRG